MQGCNYCGDCGRPLWSQTNARNHVPQSAEIGPHYDETDDNDQTFDWEIKDEDDI